MTHRPTTTLVILFLCGCEQPTDVGPGHSSSERSRKRLATPFGASTVQFLAEAEPAQNIWLFGDVPGDWDADEVSGGSQGENLWNCSATVDEVTVQWTNGASQALRAAVDEVTGEDPGEVKACEALLDADEDIQGEAVSQEDEKTQLTDRDIYHLEASRANIESMTISTWHGDDSRGYQKAASSEFNPLVVNKEAMSNAHGITAMTPLLFESARSMESTTTYPAEVAWPTEAASVVLYTNGGGTPHLAMNAAMNALLTPTERNKWGRQWAKLDEERTNHAGCLLAGLATMMVYGTPTLARRTDLGDGEDDQPNVLITGFELAQGTDLNDFYSCAISSSDEDGSENCTIAGVGSEGEWLTVNLQTIYYKDLTRPLTGSMRDLNYLPDLDGWRETLTDDDIEGWMEHLSGPCIIDPSQSMLEKPSAFIDFLGKSKLNISR